MAFDVYFKEDIFNALRSIYAAGDGASGVILELLQDPQLRGLVSEEAALTRLVQIYRRGFVTALGAVGLAFGLDRLPLSGADGALLAGSSRDALSQDRQAESSEARVLGFLWQTMNQDHYR